MPRNASKCLFAIYLRKVALSLFPSPTIVACVYFSFYSRPAVNIIIIIAIAVVGRVKRDVYASTRHTIRSSHTRFQPCAMVETYSRSLDFSAPESCYPDKVGVWDRVDTRQHGRDFRPCPAGNRYLPLRWTCTLFFPRARFPVARPLCKTGFYRLTKTMCANSSNVSARNYFRSNAVAGVLQTDWPSPLHPFNVY